MTRWLPTRPLAGGLALFAAVVLATVPAIAGDEIPNLTPDELESLMNAGEAIPVDANGASTRGKHGTVPGAVLLSDYKGYEPSAELPSDKDKKLVFYCANTMCGAAPAAAQRAQAAGYPDVCVMKDGIMGWAKAGKAVDKGKAG